MTIDEFNEIKRELAKAKAKKERLMGALDQIQGQLKSEFGVTSIEAAEAKLKELTEEQAKDMAKRDQFLEKLSNVTNWEALR